MEGESQSFVDTSSDTKLLINQLSTYVRTPKTFMGAWQATEQSETNSPARIFLDIGGFPTWFAYFLTKNIAENQRHIDGKASCKSLIAKLESATDEYRKLLATRVAAAVQPELALRVQKLYDQKITAPREDNSSDNMSQPVGKRKRVMEDDSCPTPSSINIPNVTATASEPSTHPFLDAPDHSVLGQTLYTSIESSGDYHVLCNASLEKATKLLPSELRLAIKTCPDPKNENALVADIWMTFRYSTSMVQCQMALHVKDEKVAHLARVLFDMNLETKDERRYVCIGDGRSTIMPNPRFTLQGCRLDIIASTFGPELSRAIATCPVYQDDVKQWRGSTDCVSMVITHEAQEGAVIYVSLGLWEGTQIKTELYP